MASVIQSSLPAGGFRLSESPEPSPSYLDIITLEQGFFEPKSPVKQDYTHSEYDNKYASSTVPSSPTYSHSMRSSYFTTPSTYSDCDEDEDEDEDDAFPSFNNSIPHPSSHPPHRIYHEPEQIGSPATVSPPCSDDLSFAGTANDDQAIEHEPTQHVDYLAHEWREQDIWSSWRYVVSRRKAIQNSVRLENASWRTWTKAKYKLRTVSPESLNWLKDCDVTWLYGPLYVDTNKSLSRGQSQPLSRLSTSSSCIWKKSNLKKKSASAVILERSRSQHTLLQRAGEIIKQQRSSPAPRRPSLRRGGSDGPVLQYIRSSTAPTPVALDLASGRVSESGLQTPSDCKHISFNEEVRQVQAVDSEDDEATAIVEEDSSDEDTDEDDDGGLMLEPQRLRSNKSTPRGSFSDMTKLIEPLPSTTLKYRKDTPEPPDTPPAFSWFPSRTLKNTSSQETLRPSRPSHNFLLDDDPELDEDSTWPVPSAVSPAASSTIYKSPYAPEGTDRSSGNLRRTPSGMFMPYDEHEDEAAMNNTLIGQAMYAVNTFRDIAHVVWNVGWTRNK